MRAPPASRASSIADSAETNRSTGSTRPTSCESPTLIDTLDGACRQLDRFAHLRAQALRDLECGSTVDIDEQHGEGVLGDPGDDVVAAAGSREATGDHATDLLGRLRAQFALERVHVVEGDRDQARLVRLQAGERGVELLAGGDRGQWIELRRPRGSPPQRSASRTSRRPHVEGPSRGRGRRLRSRRAAC